MVGDFVVRTLVGRQMRVDPEALVLFEVTREEANVWLEAQLRELLEEARRRIEAFYGEPVRRKPTSVQTVEERADLMEDIADWVERVSTAIEVKLRNSAQQMREQAKHTTTGAASSGNAPICSSVNGRFYQRKQEEDTYDAHRNRVSS